MKEPTSKSPSGKPISRRRMLAALGGTAFLGAAFGGEAFARGPYSLQVTRRNVDLPGFDGSFTLAHFSDLHFGLGPSPCETLGKLVSDLAPDAISITGDLLSDLKGKGKLDRLLAMLPRPIYVVPGNWERAIDWSEQDQRRYYEKRDVVFLNNARTRSDLGVNIAGVDDPFMGIDDLQAALLGLSPGDPTILLAHGPIIGPQAAASGKVGLTLVGHTHGGQVRIPGYGPILLPGGSGDFDSGMYDIGKMKMYVNRGIGTCLIPVRLFCPPEVTLFTIRGTG
jgi:uncharacterized protein